MKGSQNDALERFVLCLINKFDKNENMDDILKQLAEIKTELQKPFPTEILIKYVKIFEQNF